jgi:hypothetical protein
VPRGSGRGTTHVATDASSVPVRAQLDRHLPKSWHPLSKFRAELDQLAEHFVDLPGLFSTLPVFLREGWCTLTQPSSSHFTSASSSFDRRTVPNSPFGRPKSPKPSTRSPRVNSSSLAGGCESGGLLARSESGVAPRWDNGGSGTLGSLDIDLRVIRDIFECCFLGVQT